MRIAKKTMIGVDFIITDQAYLQSLVEEQTRSDLRQKIMKETMMTMMTMVTMMTIIKPALHKSLCKR